MKKYLLLFAAITLITGTSCQKKVDIEKEKEAILNVLNEEGNAFAAKDMERVFATHVQDSLATRLEQTYNSYQIFKGWNEIKKMYEGYNASMMEDTVTANFRNLKENVIMKVTGTSAWVICDNIWKYEANGKPYESSNTQIAFFEKDNIGWKFAFNAFISKPEAEAIINQLGYTLLYEGQIKAAIIIFKVNVDEYPLSAAVYDSYAEALMKDGQNDLAIKNYKRSIELDSTNINAKEQIKILESRLKTNKQ